MEIRDITMDELAALSALRKERVDMKPSMSCHYIGAFEDGRLVGVVGWQNLGCAIRYKTDGVLPEYRGRGIYSALWAAREKAQPGIYQVTAFCTEKSLPCYLAHGFRAVSVRNGITFVKRN